MINRDVDEDACWLRPEKNVQHINVAELDAVVRGVNIPLRCKAKKLHLFTDTDTLSTKASSEILIRRRLSNLEKLVSDYMTYR